MILKTSKLKSPFVSTSIINLFPMADFEKDNSAPFLQYVVKVGLGINNQIKVVSKQEYDSLMVIEVNGKKSSISQKFADNIFVVCTKCEVGKLCSKNSCEIK